MKELTALCQPTLRVTVEYDLIASPSNHSGDLTEPIGQCTVWLERAACSHEEHPLAAWHFPASGQPTAMPVEETGESTDEVYVGQFLILPRKDLTLTRMDSYGRVQSLVQLAVAPTGSPRQYAAGGASDWGVAAVWADGCEISIRKGMHASLIAHVRSLRLSEAQCRAFVLLGGLMRWSDRLDQRNASSLVMNLARSRDASGQGKYALHAHAAPQSGADMPGTTVYRSWRAALDGANLDLGSCWLLLPVFCQGCQSPLDSERGGVETLWGRMHPDCARPLPPQGEERTLPSAPAVRVGHLPLEGQLAFPWAS